MPGHLPGRCAYNPTGTFPGPIEIYYSAMDVEVYRSAWNASREEVVAEMVIHEIGHPVLGSAAQHPGKNPGDVAHYEGTELGQWVTRVFDDLFDEEPLDNQKAYPPGYEYHKLPGTFETIFSCITPIQTSEAAQLASFRSARAAFNAYPNYTVEYHAGENPNAP